MEQAEAALADRSRALKRAHPPCDPAAPNGELNTDIFDDRDFYLVQLREFLESRGGDDRTNAALATAAARRRRTKKTGVDTRASKGRKLRCVVENTHFVKKCHINFSFFLKKNTYFWF